MPRKPNGEPHNDLTTSPAPIAHNPRIVSPYPTHHTPLNIAHEVTSNLDAYSITRELRDENRVRGICLSSCPKYLILCAKRLNAQITLSTGMDGGFTIVLHCALRSGLDQLQDNASIKKLLALRSHSYGVNAGGMLSDIVDGINSSWYFTPPAPSGIWRAPGYRMSILDDTDARIRKFAEEIGLSQSLLCITAIVFGFYNQPELLAQSSTIHDHANVIADHVRVFDFQVDIKLRIAEGTIRLMEDSARRRELAQANTQVVRKRVRRKRTGRGAN